MNSKKIVRHIGIILALLSLMSLILPIYSTYIAEGESCNMVVQGYNLAEFSIWGGIVLLAPIVLLGLMLSKLKTSVKTLGLLGLSLVYGMALCGATYAAYIWMEDVATGFIEAHLGNLAYALLLFSSMVCFWVSLNSIKDKSTDEKSFVADNRTVEPIDHKKEKYYWCNRVCDFVKYKDNGEVVTSEGTLCFATGEGYFAALMGEDIEQYYNIEARDSDGVVGHVMGAMPSGVYGMLRDGQEFLDDPDMLFEIRPFEYIQKGEAELSIPDKRGCFTCDDVYVTAYAPDNIIVNSSDGFEGPPAIGAAVMQGGELIAFVTGYDAVKHEYKCISAEMMAIDLCRRIYEHRVCQRSVNIL